MKGQKVLEGKVYIDEYTGPLVNVAITNLTKDTQVIANVYSFKIRVEIGDSLRLESSITEIRTFPITKNVYDKGKLNIHLNRYIVQLQDVDLDNMLSGYLSEDIKKVNMQNYDSINAVLDVKLNKWEFANMHKDQIIQPMNGEIQTSINFLEIGGALYNLIKQNRQKTIHTPPKTLEEIRTYLGDALFVEIGIPKAEIDIFLHYTYRQDKQLLYKNYLEIIKILSMEAEPYVDRDKTKIIE